MPDPYMNVLSPNRPGLDLTVAPASARPPIPPLRLHGMRLINDNAAGLADAEGYLGTRLGFVTGFAEANNASGTWADSLQATKEQAAALAPLNRPIHWGIPICHGTLGHGAVETLRGDHDATIREMFVVMGNANPDEQYLFGGPGWEMNFWSAYPWCRAFITNAQFRALYRKIVTIGRAVDDRWVFDFCPNIRVIASDGKVVDPTQFYPGDAFVDHIDTHAYLRGDIEQTILGLMPAQTIANVWDGEWGINQLTAWAEGRGKMMSMTETGITGDGTANNSATGDLYSAHFNRAYEWFRTGNRLLYGVWNKSTPFNCRLSGAQPQYPVASAAHKAGFDRVAKPWTPALQFGRELIEHRSAKDAALMVMDNSTLLVTSWADRVGGKLASNAASARPTYSATARNGLPGVTGDGADDVLVQADVTAVPVTGKAHTTFLQAFTSAAAANFSYLLADTDTTGGGTQTRAIGHNAGALYLRSGGAGYAGPVIRPSDASIVVAYRDVVLLPAPIVTVQGSVNGGAPWSDNVVLPNPSMTITKRVLFGNGSASDGVSQRIAGTIQEQGTIARIPTPSETQMLHGYLAWEWGTVANLPTRHPFKTSRPTYGGPM